MSAPQAQRLAGLGTSIFTEMTALAVRTGAINLGQGFPDTDGPPAVIEAAVAALRAGENQYAPLPGVPACGMQCSTISGSGTASSPRTC